MNHALPKTLDLSQQLSVFFPFLLRSSFFDKTILYLYCEKCLRSFVCCQSTQLSRMWCAEQALLGTHHTLHNLTQLPTSHSLSVT